MKNVRKIVEELIQPIAEELRAECSAAASLLSSVQGNIFGQITLTPDSADELFSAMQRHASCIAKLFSDLFDKTSSLQKTLSNEAQNMYTRADFEDAKKVELATAVLSSIKQYCSEGCENIPDTFLSSVFDILQIESEKKAVTVNAAKLQKEGSNLSLRVSKYIDLIEETALTLNI